MEKTGLVRTRPDTQICYMVYIVLLWSENILTKYVRVLLTYLPIIWFLADTFIVLLYVFFFLFSLRTFVQRVFVKDVLIVFGCLLIYLLYYLLFPYTHIYYDAFSELFVEEALPMYLVGVSLYHEKNKKLLDILYVVSLVTVLAFTVYTLFFKQADEILLMAGDMDAAYKVLPHICMVFGYVMKKATILNIATFSIGAAVLFSLGTRGAVLCLAVDVILMLLFVRKIRHPILFASIALSGALVLIYGGVFDALYTFAEQNGLSLRVFDKFMNGEITDSKGRDAIRERVLQYISMYPISGYGIYADRVATGGIYAHNIVLELMLEFGIFIGLAIFVGLVLLLLRAFTVLHRNMEMREMSLFLTLLCSSFFKLFLSGSYLTEAPIYLLFGYCVAILRTKRMHESPCDRANPPYGLRQGR